MKTVNVAETGKKLKRMRKASGIKLKDLIKEIGIASFMPIYKWENGKCLPKVDTLLNLAAVYGVSMEEMLVINEV